MNAGCLARTRTYRNYNAGLVEMRARPQLGPQENVVACHDLSLFDTDPEYFDHTLVKARALMSDECFDPAG